MERTCAECGYENPLGANFCSSCGAQLSDRRADATEALDPTIDAPVVDAAGAAPGYGMLVVRQGSKRGSRIALDAERIQIGRHPESDIFLDDVTVSRRHAEILRGATGYEVIDAGSLNGTYVNRERVDRASLSDGDQLQVGKFKLVYVALEDDG
ncbi:MAG: FHA domain-containing protein [Acidimicrobiales bacterium]